MPCRGLKNNSEYDNTGFTGPKLKNGASTEKK